MKELYKITSEPETNMFKVRLNPDHIVFQGHFPDNPVLPGICSLMIIRECTSQMIGLPLGYISVKESKFLAAITPDTELIIKLKLLNDGNDYYLEATIHSEAKIMLKLKAHLR